MEKFWEIIRIILVQILVAPIVYLVFKLIYRWKIEGAIPDVPKMVVAFAPHTSNLDFLFLLPMALKFKRWPFWLGKKEMFEWFILGKVFYALNGIPIDRDAPLKAMKQTMQTLNAHEEIILCLAPEGTRKYTDSWKKGFYQIAHKLKLPIVFIAFDYGSRTVRIREALYTSGDAEADIELVRPFYEGVVGKNPENAGLIQLEA